MKATTIKLEGTVLRELEELKQPDQNLTSLVRDLLKAQIHRRKMLRAAEDYASFLNENGGESLELDVWEAAPLDKEPSVRRKRRA